MLSARRRPLAQRHLTAALVGGVADQDLSSKFRSGTPRSFQRDAQGDGERAASANEPGQPDSRGAVTQVLDFDDEPSVGRLKKACSAQQLCPSRIGGTGVEAER